MKQLLWMTIVGWILTIVPTVMFVGGGTYAAIHPEMMRDGFKEMGWPLDVAPYLIAVEIICGLIYVFPKTSVFGAILLTGYLGGAVATHVRIHDPKGVGAVVFGILIWLGVYLREPRLRKIVFWR
ncbi:MAG TPA: DoxX family protein [Tepidisphaeraceae bacterium]|jgi:hypothetical protein|nr:DoxX family protein [Tepidisphaeraceae bacterium]